MAVRVKKPRKPTEADLLLPIHMRELGIPLVKEHKFSLTRQWQFDFANVEYRVAFEIEGGIHTGGRHTRGEGYQGDLTKYNMATALGWTLFRFSTEDVKTGDAKEVVKIWLGNRGGKNV